MTTRKSEKHSKTQQSPTPKLARKQSPPKIIGNTFLTNGSSRLPDSIRGAPRGTIMTDNLAVDRGTLAGQITLASMALNNGDRDDWGDAVTALDRIWRQIKPKASRELRKDAAPRDFETAWRQYREDGSRFLDDILRFENAGLETQRTRHDEMVTRLDDLRRRGETLARRADEIERAIPGHEPLGGTPPNQPAAGGGGEAPLPSLDADDFAILRKLACTPALCVRLAEIGCRNEKTVGKHVRKCLMPQGLVCRPKGARGGLQITRLGLTAVNQGGQ